MTIKARAERYWKILKRYHAGKTVGTIVGLVGGWFGAAMGFVIGYMIDTLLAQRRTDQAIADYFDNPGPSPFSEQIPGSAAFCGLAVLVSRGGEEKDEPDDSLMASRIARLAASVFAAGEISRDEMEVFSRVASWKPEALNPDLLAESLRARLRGRLDEAVLREAVCAALDGLASNDRARELAERVAALVSPGRAARKTPAEDDPYAILGIAPDAPEDEVKTVYRRLAVQFHPDGTGVLTDGQKKSAAEAFLRIDDAYRRILSRQKN